MREDILRIITPFLRIEKLFNDEKCDIIIEGKSEKELSARERFRMRIAFCDDEKECRGELAHLLFEYTEKKTGYKINIAEFCTASALIKDVIRNGGYDIYILDIVMPEMNGIELGKWLRNHGHEGKIIYLTSSEEYAIESYKVKAFNYILKPINKNVMNDTINEIIKEIITKRERNIIIKSKGNSTRVNYDSIMYAELCRRIIVFHLVDGRSIESVTIRTTFSENVQELLRDNRLFRSRILCCR